MAERVEVLVLGAGMAGLAAARRLHDHGLRVRIVEARERIGGRIWTALSSEGFPLELGAEWIHGEPPALLAVASRAGERILGLQARHFRWSEAGLRDYGALHRSSSRLAAPIYEDISVAERARREGWSREEWRAAVRVIEGFDAADPMDASAIACSVEEDALSSGRTLKLQRGYGPLCASLAQGLDIRLGAVARTIRWSPGEVRVRTSRGVLRAERLLVTLPLGVLQARPPAAGALRWHPALPAKEEALLALRMGSACKMVAHFHHPLPLPSPAFVHAPQLPLPLWWSAGPAGGRTWVGWAGGGAVARMGMEPLAAAIRSLARLIGEHPAWIESGIERLSGWDWLADPFSRGAYSYLPAGGFAAQRILAEPVAGTLFFAGEATSRDNAGTVHGALESGWRAADEVLSALRLQGARSPAPSDPRGPSSYAPAALR